LHGEWVIFRSLVVVAFACSSASIAHGGDDHGATPPAPVAADHQRSIAVSSTFAEAVLRWPKQAPSRPLALRLLLSDFVSNEPLEGATITLHTVQSDGVALPQVSFASTPSPGIYSATLGPVQAGAHAGTLTVVVGDHIDSLPLAALLFGDDHDDHDNDDDHSDHHDDHVSPVWPALGGAACGAAFIAALWWFRRRSAATVVGLLCCTQGLAHGADEHAVVPPPSSTPLSATEVSMAKESQFLLGVRTTRVKRAPIADELVVQALVTAPPQGHAALFAGQAGRATFERGAVPVLGSVVKKGQLLATIDAALDAGDRASFAVAAAQADTELAAAEAALEAATRHAERMVALTEVVSQRQRDHAAVDVSERTAAVRVARAKRDAYGASGSSTRLVLRAPIDGVLADVDVSPGELMAMGHRLFLIVDPREMWVEARIPEANISLLSGNPTVVVEVDAWPGQVITGKLHAIGEVVDDRSRTIKAIITVDNQARLLKLGMFAQARIRHGMATESLLIPRTSVLDVDGQPTVFVHTAPERFERRVVMLGRGNLDHVEVTGVAVDERVAISGLLSLQHAPAAAAP
jgi:membrane fusion protein, heavy metal efflux system